MEQIIQELSNWQYLSELPNTLYGFILEKQMNESDDKFFVFTYHNDERKRSFSVLYDRSTKEYTVRITIGLTEFCDIRYIVGNLNSLEKVLREKLECTLNDLVHFNIGNIDCIVLEKKIIEWPYTKQLPKMVGNFALFISPNEPVKSINGSYIIIDYSDFDGQNNFIIYYNIFRDEFFGEIKAKRTPQMTAEFDEKNLFELEEILEDKLVRILESIK